MDPWSVLVAGLIIEVAGLVALWARLESRERTRRHDSTARVDVAQVVARGGRVTEYYPDGGRKVVIEVRTLDQRK
ncbi:hypothetical protein ACQEU5_21025 [Marinactinospora thermotolerans]|uniref:Uncharacterized protein n=1 Tax=Marinactinospora thermotolerans DSM 45154 TaxID=1122192 RepID=A0A1T4PKC7_9ACTN|nr:hypothetical protein [Marinactinospora thermotolerans]SJZ91909.1 hypothetical protein SAMN02745673_01857 [Marinactinospora thermotolerans DSM 45154]